MVDTSNLAPALQYAALGWTVIPTPVGSKLPSIKWKRYQEERPSERIVREWFARPSNVFIITGAVSRLIVVDSDDPVALAWWKSQLGDALEHTAAVRSGSGNGIHYYFRLPAGLKLRGKSSAGGETGKWDVRAEGGGVVAPPSVHPSGGRYEWIRGPEHLQDAPDELLSMWKTGGPGKSEHEDDSPRSMLVHLLAHPPGEGGRNNWLAQVAGHYAVHIPHKDAYEHLVREAADKLSPELPEEEIAKLVESIWRAEQAKEGRAAPELDGEADSWRKNLVEPAEATGWLVSGGDRVLVQCAKKSEGGIELVVEPWLDCDVRVVGVVEAEEDQVYGVELRFPDGTLAEDQLPAKVISDPRALHAWLARHGASIGTPDRMHPKSMRETSRLLRYLRSQGAQPMIAVNALGWHPESEAFITHEGIIRADGPEPFEHVRPDPRIRGWATYRYGHAGREPAREVLREVLTFHHERVAAVFGAWWAAVLLKPQILERTSQFPFMALEATSESGKTTGFFPLMLSLGGSKSTQGIQTRAALRDALSAHHNGFAWADDKDTLDDIGELLRAVTVGGAMVKKGEGNHEQVVAQMRSALIVSGESLGIQEQKALVDRAVILDVPSPTERMSRHGNYPQWDDIVRLRRKHPDLTDFAGSVVELALQHEAVARGIKQLRRGSGRHADTIAIVRCGARVLSGMLQGDPWVVDEVEEWAVAAERNYTGKENALTMKLLPRALASIGWKSRPEGPDPSRRTVATPTFVDEAGDLWFSPKLLAQWWEREPPVNKRLNPRVESAPALEQQARELGLGGRKGADRRDFRLATGEGTQRYWRMSGDLARLVIDRSRGQEDNGEEPDGQDENRQLFNS